MATFTNVSGEDRDIPVHNLLVLAGADFDVPDEDADGLRAQGWCVEKTSTPTVTEPTLEPVTPTPAPEPFTPPETPETVTAPVDAKQGD